MKFHEAMFSMRREEPDGPIVTTTRYYSYHQPLWRWLIAKAYFWYSLHDRWLRPVDRWRMKRWHMPENCAWGHDHGNDDFPCGNIPLSNQRDLTHYDLSQKGRKDWKEINGDYAPVRVVVRAESFRSRMDRNP